MFNMTPRKKIDFICFIHMIRYYHFCTTRSFNIYRAEYQNCVGRIKKYYLQNKQSDITVPTCFICVVLSDTLACFIYIRCLFTRYLRCVHVFEGRRDLFFFHYGAHRDAFALAILKKKSNKLKLYFKNIDKTNCLRSIYLLSNFQ